MMWVKCLVLGFIGSIVDGGFNTPWRTEYHVYRKVRTREKQAWRRTRASLSGASGADLTQARQGYKGMCQAQSGETDQTPGQVGNCQDGSDT